MQVPTLNTDGLCWCNSCYSRRAISGSQKLKLFDCPKQQLLDAQRELEEQQKQSEVAQDAVVEANRKLLLERSKVGIGKYGVTLAGSGLTRRQLLQHALEEALDLANYLQAEIMREDAANVESSQPGT